MLNQPEPVDTQTLFAMASTTKAMTATCLGMLVDEGKLRWDDPVINYLPDARLAVYVQGNLDHAMLRHALMYRAFDEFALGIDQVPGLPMSHRC